MVTASSIQLTSTNPSEHTSLWIDDADFMGLHGISDEASESGTYMVKFNFPRPGRYALALDFVVKANNNPGGAEPNATMSGPKMVCEHQFCFQYWAYVP